MVPVWIAVVFLAVVSLFLSFDLPRQTAANTQVAADISATDFMAYRRAVQSYLQANPTATGTITDASLKPYWLKGYEGYDPAVQGWVRKSPWTNLVDGSALYIYAAPDKISGAMRDLVYKKSGASALVGVKNADTHHLHTLTGFDTGIVLPEAISNNSFVIMGR